MIGILATLIGLAFGGWAVITVENLPEYFIAGKTTNVTFSVRQHGHELLGGLRPTVTLRAGKHEKTIKAVKTNRAGFYTVGINVPESGMWDVEIHSGFGRSKIDLQPIAAIAVGARPASFGHEARGRQLFVAKGCASCHVHARVSGSGIYQAGPALTDRKFPEEYLKKFLADPTIKPPTVATQRMPDLDLKSSEISSLIAFINGARQALGTR